MRYSERSCTTIPFTMSNGCGNSIITVSQYLNQNQNDRGTDIFNVLYRYEASHAFYFLSHRLQNHVKDEDVDFNTLNAIYV